MLVPKKLVAWWVKHHSLRLHVLFNRKNNNNNNNNNNHSQSRSISHVYNHYIKLGAGVNKNRVFDNFINGNGDSRNSDYKKRTFNRSNRVNSGFNIFILTYIIDICSDISSDYYSDFLVTLTSFKIIFLYYTLQIGRIG